MNPGARLHRPIGYQATSPRPLFGCLHHLLSLVNIKLSFNLAGIVRKNILIKYIGGEGSTYHYKRIAVPQLTLSDMLSVQVFTKPYSITFDGVEDLEQAWSESMEHGTLYDEGCVYIYYRVITGDPLLNNW